eukprot:Nk52_evm67s1073 gene=Nk52_evmTU67s1073
MTRIRTSSFAGLLLLVVGVLLVALSVCTRPVEGQFVWSKLSSVSTSTPAARTNPALGYYATGNILILFGGKGSAGFLSDTWVYDLNANTWTEWNLPTSPEARYSLVYGVDTVNQQFIISTGEGSGKTFFNDAWALDLSNLAALSWKKLTVTGDIPDTRYGAGGGIYPGSQFFYVTHGFSDERYSDTFQLNLQTNTWTKTFDGTNPYNPSLPHARCLFGSSMVDTHKLVLYGGCLSGGGSAGPCPSQDSWVYTGDGDWEQNDMKPTPRKFPTVSHLSNSANFALLYGGKEKDKTIISVDESSADEVAVLDISDNSWKLYSSTGDIPSKRDSHVAVSVPALSSATTSDIYMFGGELLAGGLSNELFKLSVGSSFTNEISGTPNWFSYGMLHGLFMAISWGMLLPVGVVIARYFKHKDPLWFQLHRIIQLSGVLLFILGLVFGILARASGGSHFQFAHGIIGIIVILLGIAQPIGAFFRPHKDAPKRWIFNLLHWWGGRIALALGVVNISLGFFMIIAPEGAWIAWYVYLGIFIVVVIVFEICHRKKLWLFDGADMGSGRIAESHEMEKQDSQEGTQ